ncbi:hypothetical protein T484DRAFT_1784881 [Baffinella frigidus]|nr:hypothetical protein T484DRAFT_1784881 [Cryptophyta sp. CCMP2293]
MLTLGVLAEMLGFPECWTARMLGFPEYGHFVIMLKKMVRQDMVKFFHIYTVFLFGFSHLFYIVKFFHIYTVFLFGFSHLFYIVFFRQNQEPSWV